MTKKNETKTVTVEDLAAKVITITDAKDRQVQVLPIEGEAATEALDKVCGKYPNVDRDRGIVQGIREQKRFVFAMCTENPSEPIGWLRTSDLFQCKLGATARSQRPTKGKSGGSAKLMERIAAQLDKSES